MQFLSSTVKEKLPRTVYKGKRRVVNIYKVAPVAEYGCYEVFFLLELLVPPDLHYTAAERMKAET